MKEFKVGDKVYIPEISGNILYIEDSGSNGHPLQTEGSIPFDSNGKISSQQRVPSVFHATKENRAKLIALYDMYFEEPITGSDLTRKLLSEGHSVLCYVSDVSEDKALLGSRVDIITELSCDEFKGTMFSWTYAVPVKDSIKFVTGE